MHSRVPTWPSLVSARLYYYRGLQFRFNVNQNTSCWAIESRSPIESDLNLTFKSAKIFQSFRDDFQAELFKSWYLKISTKLFVRDRSCQQISSDNRNIYLHMKINNILIKFIWYLTCYCSPIAILFDNSVYLLFIILFIAFHHHCFWKGLRQIGTHFPLRPYITTIARSMVILTPQLRNLKK